MDKYKITDSELESGVVAAPNILNDTPQENKSVFDRLPRLIAGKVNGFIDAVISKFADYYNKSEIDGKETVLKEAINTKANADEVYKKTETYTKGEVDSKETALSDRINAKANSADVYEKSETYTKAETDEAIAQRVTDIGAGDMAKAVYDTDGDGVVDDAEKLNGQPASYYATKTEVETAQTTANAAQTSADNAKTTADAAATTATSAKTTADNAMPKSGGKFTGAVTLKGDPTANLHPATKQYVDKLKPTLVWSNASPTSNYNNQTLSLNLANCNGVIINIRWNNSSKGIETYVLPKDMFNEEFRMISYCEGGYVERTFKVTTTGIVFSAATSISWWIPYKIYTF